VRGVCGAHNTKDKYGTMTASDNFVDGSVRCSIRQSSGHGTDRLSRNVGTDLPLYAA
jgi:hypothetical protein